jgi:hypothetical protein
MLFLSHSGAEASLGLVTRSESVSPFAFRLAPLGHNLVCMPCTSSALYIYPGDLYSYPGTTVRRACARPGHSSVSSDLEKTYPVLRNLETSRRNFGEDPLTVTKLDP